MKKADMIEKVDIWKTEITEKLSKRNIYFEELQFFAAERGYPISDSAFENFKNVISTPYISPESLQLATEMYRNYCFTEGLNKAVTDFMDITDNFNL